MLRLHLPFVLFSAIAPAFSQSFAGDWRGRVEVPGAPLAVVVHLTESDALLRASIDIPAQGADAMPIVGFVKNGDALTFAIEDVPGEPTFRGQLAADSGTFVGTFTQAGHELKFSLARAGALAAASKARFDDLQGWLDETRAMFDAPGVAVAVIEGERLATTLVSGQCDEGAHLPVIADTLFAIGSSTKAFTTCLLAMLVDDGVLDWDKPVRTWLPDFALADAEIGERLTPRDLVTHRSGMPRHDPVWYGATFERAEMVHRLRYLPLNHDLRTDFQYNNLMFLTAGYQ
ncbi:MAG: serine hydrolase domain-containing protein [Planctomycetota bacterium]